MTTLELLKKQKLDLVDFTLANDISYSEYETVAKLNAQLSEHINKLENKQLNVEDLEEYYSGVLGKWI